jgi:hypothetical protein
MKKLILITGFIAFLIILITISYRSSLRATHARISLNYACADLGYTYGMIGKTREELFDRLDPIIGKNPDSGRKRNE